MQRFSNYTLDLDFLAKEYWQKAVRKTLLKLTLSVNLTNILRAVFSYKSVFHSFSLITLWIWNFLAKGYWQKAARKTLLKLTLSVNLTNIL